MHINIVMDYLERLSLICAVAELSDEQADILRDLTDPLYHKDREYSLDVFRGIISKLVLHERCEKLAELIQEKWTVLKSEPDAYEDLTDDVLCG